MWLFDLDNTLHDASHAAFGEMHVAIGDYVVEHVGVSREEADRLRQRYWLRYGATLLGLVRHHGVRAAHFLDQTHRLPGLEERLRTSAHDRAVLARLPGRKIILTNAPRAYAMRVLGTLGLAKFFERIVTIEDMTMFGALRPKPDARMLRRVVGEPRRRAEPLRPGRGHAGPPEGGALDRHARRLDAALRRRPLSRRLARPPQRGLRHAGASAPRLSEAGLPLCQNRRAPHLTRSR